jgi:hypothetical protein
MKPLTATVAALAILLTTAATLHAFPPGGSRPVSHPSSTPSSRPITPPPSSTPTYRRTTTTTPTRWSNQPSPSSNGYYDDGYDEEDSGGGVMVVLLGLGCLGFFVMLFAVAGGVAGFLLWKRSSDNAARQARKNRKNRDEEPLDVVPVGRRRNGGYR